MGFVKCTLKTILRLIIVALIITFTPYLPPAAEFTKTLQVPSAPELRGALKPNTKLDSVELWQHGRIIGPEAFAHYNGELYTTLHGGDVVKLSGSHITPVVKFGRACKGIHQEAICGRPLGLTFDSEGRLYVCDAYYGVFRVDVKSGDYELLIGLNDEIDGKKPKLPNSITVSRNGDIYWTDSSAEFTLQDGMFDMLADGTGRLIHFNPKTGRNTVLIDELHFSNGVILSDDESFVLVAETAANRIHRYHLKGNQRGEHDVFIEGLPGMPDNLNSDGQGGFLVPLVVAMDAEYPVVSQILGPFPLIRRFLARSLSLIEAVFKITNHYYPNEFSERTAHSIGHFSSAQVLYPPRVTILRISKTGEVLDSLHTTNKRISGISAAYIFGDKLYLGSPFNDYIGRIPLSTIGWSHLAQKSTDKPAAAAATAKTPKEKSTTIDAREKATVISSSKEKVPSKSSTPKATSESVPPSKLPEKIIPTTKETTQPPKTTPVKPAKQQPTTTVHSTSTSTTPPPPPSSIPTVAKTQQNEATKSSEKAPLSKPTIQVTKSSDASSKPKQTANTKETVKIVEKDQIEKSNNKQKSTKVEL